MGCDVINSIGHHTSHVTVAVRWGATLMEPLLSPVRRVGFDSGFRRILANSPKWFATFSAGILSGLVSVLPPTDRWRTVVIDTEGVARWPSGEMFGRPRDSFDVADPINPTEEEADLGTDPRTVALEYESPLASRITIRGFEGWRAVRQEIMDTLRDFGPRDTFDATTAAIRLAAHRHRAYRPGVFDNWLSFLVVEWAHRTDEMLNEPPDNARNEQWFSQFIDRDIARERDALTEIALQLFTHRGQPT